MVNGTEAVWRLIDAIDHRFTDSSGSTARQTHISASEWGVLRDALATQEQACRARIDPLAEALRACRPFVAYAYDQGIVGAEDAGRHLDAALDQQPAGVDEAPKGYYLASFKHRQPNAILWWGPDNKGYTPDLAQAGIYTHLSPGYHDSEHTVPVPVEFVQRLRVRHVVDPGDQANTIFWTAEKLRDALAATQQGGAGNG